MPDNSVFQSTAGLSPGRSTSTCATGCMPEMFQSTAGLSPGRSARPVPASLALAGFNPQPGFHPAEANLARATYRIRVVSIHSRAFTRPKPEPSPRDSASEHVSIHSRAFTRPKLDTAAHDLRPAVFQSTAGLSPGRSDSASLAWSFCSCFSPQPGFHPAEACGAASYQCRHEVSIHSRAFTRPKPRSVPTPDRSPVFQSTAGLSPGRSRLQ